MKANNFFPHQKIVFRGQSDEDINVIYFGIYFSFISWNNTLGLWIVILQKSALFKSLYLEFLSDNNPYYYSESFR